ncbi:MAG: hypothetical protein Ta2B_28250 [Termitinemataceae bacterium]|nr:MAG: hypothetical protein Ta2B_28250 [Termitinemataceae bacterium]
MQYFFKVIVFVLFFSLSIANLFAQEAVDNADNNNVQTEIENDPQLDKKQRNEILNVESARNVLQNEAPPEILSLTVNDADVSLFLHGYWTGTLSGQWGFQKNKYGIIPEQGMILFDMEPSLNLSLWIYKKWFIETFFEEGYEEGVQLSSYAAGYKGGEDELVQFAVIGNKMLDFPRYPYIDLGADTPLSNTFSSFGFYGRFGGGNLKLHTLLRYDAATREERVFVGGRERNYTYVTPSSMLRGISFVLPSENIQTAITVYIEDKDGNYSGDGGTKWRRANSGEYAASAKLGIVELAKEPDTMIAVVYGDVGASVYEDAMGLYGDSSGRFLQQVQRYFSETDLTKYPQAGQRSAVGSANKPGIIKIDGSAALVIYEKGTFSPFERQSLYKSPQSNAVSAMLVGASTNERINGWIISERSENSLWTEDPLFFSPANEYVTMRRSIYELSIEQSSVDIRSPRSRWPLARDAENSAWNYNLYLVSANNADVNIRWTTLGAENGFNIGTDIVPGSIIIKRSGLDDPNFGFDASSGRITLSNPPFFSEIIRISYLKRSNNSSDGSFAAALGTVWSINEHLTSENAIAFRWNVFANPESEDAPYSKDGSASPGTIALTNKFSFNYDKLKANINLGGGYKQNDTHGLYRVAGMENGVKTITPLEQNSFLSVPPADNPPQINGLTFEKRAPLVYRNYKETDILGNSHYKDIGENAAVVDSGNPDDNTPYTANDPLLGGRILAAEFALNGGQWSGFESQLADAQILSEAAKIEVPYRFYGFSNGTSGSAVRLIIQIGSLAGKNLNGSENTELIVQEILYDGSTRFNEMPRIARIVLSDADRRKLQNATHIRYLVENTSGGQFSGRLLTAPLIVYGAKFTPLVKSGVNIKTANDKVYTMEVMDQSLRSKYSYPIRRLNVDNAANHVLEIGWGNPESAALVQGESAGAGSRVGVIPFSTYKKLSFFVKGDFSGLSGSTFDFIISQNADAAALSSKTALKATIKTEDLMAGGAGSWTKVELNYSGGENTVFVGGKQVAASLTYHPSALRSYNSDNGETENDSAFVMFFLNPAGGSTLAQKKIYIDEIILEDSTADLWLNAGGRFEYKNTGTIVSVNDTTLIENFSLETSVETSTQGNIDDTENGEQYFGITQRASSAVTILGAELSGNFAYTSAQDNFWWNGGHGISRKFGQLVISEVFSAAPKDDAWNHNAAIMLNGNINLFVSGESVFQSKYENRNFAAGFGIKEIAALPLGFSLDAKAAWTEKTENENMEINYGSAYINSWHGMIIDSGSSAEQRKIAHNVSTSLTTKPVGMQLSFNGATAYKRIEEKTEASLGTVLSFPWKAKVLSGTFSIDRSIKRSLFFQSANAGEDFMVYRKTLDQGSDLLLEPPVYSLFDREVSDKMNSFLSASESVSDYGNFNDKYKFLLRTGSIYGLKTLYIPQSFEAQIARQTSRTYDTVLDLLNIGCSLNFSSVNLFGVYGAKSLFRFYQNDQFNTAISYNVSIPKDSDPRWRLGINQNITFYGFNTDELEISDVVNIFADACTVALNLSWTAPAAKSLLGSIFNFAVNGFADKKNYPMFAYLASANLEQLREESLELFFDKSTSNFIWSLSAGHKSIVRVLGTVNFNMFASIGIQDNTAAEIFSFIGTIGTSLSVQF